MITDPKTITPPQRPAHLCLAAERIEASGQRPTQNQRIVAFLKEHPGVTCGTSARPPESTTCGWRSEWAKVRMLGFAPGDPAYVEATGSMMQTWWPVTDDGQLRMF